MHFILFHVEGSAQRKLPGPQKGVLSRSLKFLIQKDGKSLFLSKFLYSLRAYRDQDIYEICDGEVEN